MRNRTVRLSVMVLAAAVLGACISGPGSARQQREFNDAARNGNLEVVQELLAVVDINEDLGSASALQLAAFNAYYDVVVFLVENGADVNQRDPGNGWTALDFARTGQAGISPREDHPRVIEYLESLQ